jgi:hypothetical protein
MENGSQVNEIPRRINLQTMTVGEKAIRDAVMAVETMGADPKLTDVIVDLDKCFTKLANYTDGVEETFLDRLRVEYNELTAKIDKLQTFLADPKEAAKKVGVENAQLLYMQHTIMISYAQVLHTRIQRLTSPVEGKSL